MNQKVIIIGASGHGRVVADIVRSNGDVVVGFLDDDMSKNVLGRIDSYSQYDDVQFVIAIGNTEHRIHISETLDCNWYTAIHPSAVISPSVTIGAGTVIMPNAVVNVNARVGKHCIINTAAVIEHDNIIGDYSHISVGAKLGGTVSVGKRSWVGIGSTVSNNVSICDDTIIGAGAVVVKNINTSGIYIGVPAKRHGE